MLAIFRNPAYDIIDFGRPGHLNDAVADRFIGRGGFQRKQMSLAHVAVCLGSILVKGGLRYDLDFTGGTLVELRLAEPVGD